MFNGIQPGIALAILILALRSWADEPAATPIRTIATDGSPESSISQIEDSLRAIPDTEDRARAFPAMKARFLSAFPQHPLRWQLRFTEGMLAAQNDESDRQSVAESVFREIVSAADSPPSLKAKASGLILAFRYKTFLEKKCALTAFREAVESHIKSYPKEEGNDQYARWLIDALLPRDPETRSKKLEEMTHSDLPALAHAAREKLEIQERLEALRKKPLEMNFTAIDGRSVSLCALRGKVVLVDFWASWSLESLALLPSRMAAYQKFKDRGFEIIGVSFDEDKQSFLDILTAKQITWPQLFDGKALNNPLGTRYGIEGLPVSWLLDQQGLLVHTDLVTGLEQEIQKLLAK